MFSSHPAHPVILVQYAPLAVRSSVAWSCLGQTSTQSVPMIILVSRQDVRCIGFA